MNRWELTYRFAVVGLLTVIALQLGGWQFIAEAFDHGRRAIANAGKPKEEAARAPPGAGFQFDNTKQLQGMADLAEIAAKRASAPN